MWRLDGSRMLVKARPPGDVEAASPGDFGRPNGE
jgi:hypothetical protein